MVSLLGEVINRLIQLLTFRRNERREKFERLVEPLYRKAETVTADLIKFYREIMEGLFSSPYNEWNDEQRLKFVNSVRSKRHVFEDARQRLLTVRLELKTACIALAEEPLFASEEQNIYLRRMLEDILSILEDPDGSKFSSRPKNLLDSINVMIEPTSNSERWRNEEWFIGTFGQIKSMCDSTERYWGSISRSYSKLKHSVYK